MNKTFRRFFYFMLLTILIAGCQSTELIIPTQTSVPAKPTAPPPSVNKSVLTGQVLSSLDAKPLGNIPVRLAQVFRQGQEGAFALDLAHSPSSISDINGYFTIIDIAPAEYVLVVGKPEDNNYALYKENEANPTKTFTIVSNQLIDIGTIKSTFKP
jgi:hypothetical protein